MSVRVVLISDTHGLHRRVARLPEGDLLIHAGDCSNRGELAETAEFLQWFGDQRHAAKILVAGNHDFCFEQRAELAESLVPAGVHYLFDRGIQVKGLSVWGSPWQPWFYDWAFNLERGEPLAAKWRLIPTDTDVLVTHGPPQGILDRTSSGDRVGCEALRARLDELPNLQLHVFGHIHEGYGTQRRGRCQMVNASICDVQYRPVNRPIVIDLIPQTME